MNKGATATLNVKADTNWLTFDSTTLSGNLAGTFRFFRGFTGHEHYADLGIINMNGRLYDPVIARFFSPDNFVQAPDFTQSYNRYSYCLNNPLQYTDPSGESFIATAFAIGALTNVFFQMISGNINSAGDFLFSAGIGGLAGMAGAAAGSAAASAVGIGGFLGGAASGAASGAAAGAINSFGNTFMSSHNLGTSIGYGFLGGFMGALGGGLTGGLSRGILDDRHGYNFWDGSFYEEFVTGEVVPDGNYAAIADYYNNSSIADQYDAALANRYKEMFGVERCDFNIEEITTRTTNFGVKNPKYGMDGKWQFVRLSDNMGVGGFVSGNSVSGTHIHISPYTMNRNDIVFRALAGHELAHAYHHYLAPILGCVWDPVYSDRAAYLYTFNVYTRYNYTASAVSIYNTANSMGRWGSFPIWYSIPFYYQILPY